jgi:VWFA-related protein
MKKVFAACLLVALLLPMAPAQTPQQTRKPQDEKQAEDVVRVSTSLVQTDVVVTDKNDKVVPDLKLEDFELYDNGKQQELKFMEFVGINTDRRVEGSRPQVTTDSGRSVVLEPTGNTGVAARDLRRVVAFVIDDLNMEIQDLPAVRELLMNFVNNKMGDGDLVAIVRVIGGKGLLQQFTSDRALLRRAIGLIRPVVHPFASSSLPDAIKLADQASPVAGSGDSPLGSEFPEAPDISSANDETIRYFRSLSVVTSASLVIESLKQLPGRKDIVLISDGIPLFQSGGTGTSANTSYVLALLTDRAFRAGVAINSLDPRGLRATPGVVGFQATPAKSALGGNDPNDMTFGHGGALDQAAFGSLLAGGEDHLGLSTVAAYTGGVSVINTNNFDAGLDKILARSTGYYTLAYRPTEKLDNKFHKLEIKVKRGGTKVYNHTRYLAREEADRGPLTREDQVVAAATSPLMKNDLDVTPNIAVKLGAGKADVDVHMIIGADKLHFTQTPAGTYRTSFDVVGFIFNQMGKRFGGLSETVNINLQPEQYRRALKDGVPYTASTTLGPGFYQVRAVVREEGSGNVGTFSKYMEIPDITKGKLAMSSVFLLAVDPQGKAPTALDAVRRLSPKQDLRYVAMIYNPKLKDGKPQLRSQMIISQGNKVLFQEPEQQVETNGTSPVVKVGQLGLGKVAPGRYVLTLVVTDTLADKKAGTLSQSVDFRVTN